MKAKTCWEVEIKHSMFAWYNDDQPNRGENKTPLGITADGKPVDAGGISHSRQAQPSAGRLFGLPILAGSLCGRCFKSMNFLILCPFRRATGFLFLWRHVLSRESGAVIRALKRVLSSKKSPRKMGVMSCGWWWKNEKWGGGGYHLE